jgi:hypothetical protein
MWIPFIRLSRLLAFSRCSLLSLNIWGRDHPEERNQDDQGTPDILFDEPSSGGVYALALCRLGLRSNREGESGPDRNVEAQESMTLPVLAKRADELLALVTQIR